MQFCKAISYKLRVFKMIYNIFQFLCVRIPLQYHFDCIPSLKGPKLEYITPAGKHNDKQK